MSVSIPKLHALPAVCQSFVTFRRATYENGAQGAREKQEKKITAAKHTRLLRSASGNR